MVGLFVSRKHFHEILKKGIYRQLILFFVTYGLLAWAVLFYHQFIIISGDIKHNTEITSLKLDKAFKTIIDQGNTLRKNSFIVNTYVHHEEEETIREFFLPIIEIQNVKNIILLSLKNEIDFSYEPNISVNPQDFYLGPVINEQKTYISIVKDYSGNELVFILFPVQYYDTTQGVVALQIDHDKLFNQITTEDFVDLTIKNNNTSIYKSNLINFKWSSQIKASLPTLTPLQVTIGTSVDKLLYSFFFTFMIFLLLSVALGMLIFRNTAKIVSEISSSLSSLQEEISLLQKNDYHSDPKVLENFPEEIYLIYVKFSKIIKSIQKMNLELDESVKERTQELSNALDHLRKESIRANEASEAKSIFFANISHEIRTPLNGIVGGLSLFSLDGLDSEQEEMIKIMSQCSNSLLNIVNDVLDLSKIEAGKIEKDITAFSLSDLLTELNSIFSVQANNKGVELQVVTPRTDVSNELLGDVQKLKQVLTNLISNALKFTDEGSVTISASVIQDSSTHQSIRFSIIDSGVGVSKDKVKGIFEAFSQEDSSTSRIYGGTGLGLTISQRFVELLGGEIKYTEVHPKGSNFFFELSFNKIVSTKDLSSSKKEKASNVLKKDYSSIHILVAEDNKVNQLIIKKILDSIGVKSTVVENGYEAIKESLQGVYDCIFMDIQMPDIDGFEATTKVLNHSPETIIIAMTANVFEEDKKRCYSVGMKDFIAKPISKSKVIKVIEDLPGM